MHADANSEASDKLDPMYQHKYTRRMLALGAEPDIAEVESLTPHYDKLKYPGGKPSSNKREYIWVMHISI